MIPPTVVVLALSLTAPASEEPLARGRRALARFELETALVALEEATHGSGYSYDDNVVLWESLGIARAYSDRKQAAEDAFVRLLAMAPTHVLSYTLSPKVTFPFEAARKRIAREPVAAIEFVWPRGQLAGDPLPVTVEVVRDRLALMRSVSVCAARGGEPATCGAAVAVREGVPVTYVIPRPAVAPAGGESVGIYVLVRDDSGSVVQRSSDPTTPRLVQLAHREDRAWYQRWYVWAAAAGVLATATGVIVHATSGDSPTTSATFDSQR
jgi:hypothetical protein